MPPLEDHGKEYENLVIAVDPSVSETGRHAKCGIVAVADWHAGPVQHFDVIDDFTVRGSPGEWAKAIVAAYYRIEADMVVYEANQGGAVIRELLKQLDHDIPIRSIRARVDKRLRAKPVVALYEQSRVMHMAEFLELEAEMTGWDPDDPSMDSPDRIDAMVYGVNYLNRGKVKSVWT